MKIEKLPSGTYRVRRTIQGKAVSVTFPYKPSPKEASKALEDKWSGRDRLRMTFDEAAKEYINGKRNTISPSTIRGYESIRKTLPDVIKKPTTGRYNSMGRSAIHQRFICRPQPQDRPQSSRLHIGDSRHVCAELDT